MEEKYKYKIGGKIYFQRPLVLGQINQLMEVLGGMPMPVAANGPELLLRLGAKGLPRAIAIVLCEEDHALKDKDLDALATDIGFAIDPETTLKVINDFFDCNPISSWLITAGETAESIWKTMREIGLRKPASSLAEETSQSGNGSSGTSTVPSPGPGQG